MVSNKKGVILFIVLAVVLIVVILAGAILSIISSQSRLTHHQVSRIQAYYVSKGMMNYALEKLRTGAWSLPAAGSLNHACHRNCIDPLVSVTSPAYVITPDTDIPYNVQITIHPDNTGPNNTTAQLDIKTEYTYVP